MLSRINMLLAAAVVAGGLIVPSVWAQADEASTHAAYDAAAEAAYADMQKTFGSVPSFIREVPKAAIAGLWQQTKDLEFSDKTALSPKTKALISLAVAAQIPCSYCIWSDSMTARQMGASDEEIREAVAMSGLTRQWSTIFNGMQVDFATFKKDLGGQ